MDCPGWYGCGKPWTCYAYNLLHMAIYAHNDKDNALAFLIFPQAEHHECIFHALKDVSDSCREI